MVQGWPWVVATALCDARDSDLAGRCRLKWPNDLVVEGRKLGGVLIDAVTRGDGGGLAVISFGVNHGLIEEERATSLEREVPDRTSLVDLTARLIGAVDQALERDASMAEVVGRYRRLSVHRSGDVLRCRAGGDETLGVFEGFDRHGFLRLRVGGEERLMTAGEVADDDSED